MSEVIASIHKTFILGSSKRAARTGKATLERYFWTVPGITSELHKTLDDCIQDLTDHFIDKELI